MRGDNKEEGLDIGRVVIVKRPKFAAALVVDDEGAVRYKVLSTWASQAITFLIIVMLFVTMMVAFLAYYNSRRIDSLEDSKMGERRQAQSNTEAKIKEHDSNEQRNTSNATR